MVCEPWTVPSGLKNLHAQTLKIPLAANESLLFEDSRPLLRYLFRRCASLIWTWQVLAMPATHVEWVFADISACTMPLRFSHSSKIKLSCMYRYIYIHNILNMCVCVLHTYVNGPSLIFPDFMDHLNSWCLDSIQLLRHMPLQLLVSLCQGIEHNVI